MHRQILLEICVGTLLVLLAPLTASTPLKHSATRTVPWANPCTPNGYVNSANQESRDDILEYVIEKSQDSYYHAEYIEHITLSRLGDPHIVEFLRHKNIEGFPKPAVSETEQKVNATKLLIEHYDQLSRVAVFLEYIYNEEIDMEVKAELEDLFFGHLSQMCEIQLVFVNLGQSQVFPVADRSIMSEKNQHSKTGFGRYLSDMITILKYRELLDFHISQYQKEMYFKKKKGEEWNRNWVGKTKEGCYL